MILFIIPSILNFILYFIIFPIFLIKSGKYNKYDFDSDFLWCGFLIVGLNIVGTLIMILIVLSEFFKKVYKKYIHIIYIKLGGSND